MAAGRPLARRRSAWWASRSPTRYGLDGYADLLWAAAAVGAIIWGLVLPRSTQTLVIAWICAAVASLTKNEGLTTALVVLVLIALRYRPLTLPWLRRLRAHPEIGASLTRRISVARRWTERAAFVVVPALPGLAWADGSSHRPPRRILRVVVDGITG